MQSLSIITTLARLFSAITLLPNLATSHPSTPQESLQSDAQWNSNISMSLFAELEELARIVDISYCVGLTGISKPFLCASRCSDFPSFELVDTFNTGPMMSDSCGYIAIDHGIDRPGSKGPRIIVAFRGTYSIANTIVDLSTVPQEYVPYPGNPDNSSDPHHGSPREEHRRSLLDLVPRFLRSKTSMRVLVETKPEVKCSNCTVHTGFWTSWQNTRPFILPHLEILREKYPTYKLNLVGHSLGGAVAALAGLEFNALGWEPTVTTFGEPRVGNSGLRNYVDAAFDLPSEHLPPPSRVPTKNDRYRRLTHVDDPVPLLPLQEWGYRPHAGEVYISKAALQPARSDLRACFGDEDIACIASAEVDESWFNDVDAEDIVDTYNAAAGIEELEEEELEAMGLEKRWSIPIPARYKIWQLFFAHRDYFWRLGLCVPGGDPLDWGRDKYRFG